MFHVKERRYREGDMSCGPAVPRSSSWHVGLLTGLSPQCWQCSWCSTVETRHCPGVSCYKCTWMQHMGLLLVIPSRSCSFYQKAETEMIVLLDAHLFVCFDDAVSRVPTTIYGPFSLSGSLHGSTMTNFLCYTFVEFWYAHLLEIKYIICCLSTMYHFTPHKSIIGTVIKPKASRLLDDPFASGKVSKNFAIWSLRFLR